MGGKTFCWARVSYRYSDFEFQAARRGGYGENWPIRYKDLEHYYDKVERYIGVSGSAEGLPQFPDGNFLPGFESQKTTIDGQIVELRAMLNGTRSSPSISADQPAADKSRKFSAATIKRMREAQKLRWAKIRGEAAPHAPSTQAPAPAPKPKRRLSAAARATLVANLKKARAAKAGKAKSAAPKKTASAPAQAPKVKRKLSAAGRAAIIAATKRMWAAKRAAAKQA